MVAVLAFSTLIQAAARVGVELVEVEDGGNLYVWHTPPPERAVVYIGKSARTNASQKKGSGGNGPAQHHLRGHHHTPQG